MQYPSSHHSSPRPSPRMPPPPPPPPSSSLHPSRAGSTYSSAATNSSGSAVPVRSVFLSGGEYDDRYGGRSNGPHLNTTPRTGGVVIESSPVVSSLTPSTSTVGSPRASAMAPPRANSMEQMVSMPSSPRDVVYQASGDYSTAYVEARSQLLVARNLIQEREEEVIRRQETIMRLEVELRQRNDELGKCHDAAEQQDARLSELTAMYERKCKDYVELEESVRRRDERERDLEDERDVMDDELQQLRRCLQLHQETLQGIDRAQSDVVEKLSKTKLERDELKAKFEDADSRLTRALDENQTLRETIGAARREAGGSDVVAVIRELKESSARARETFESSAHSTKGTLDEFEARWRQKLQERDDEMRRMSEKARAREDELLAKLAEKDRRLGQLDQAVVDVEAAWSASERDKAVLAAKVDVLKSQSGATEAQLDRISRQRLRVGVFALLSVVSAHRRQYFDKWQQYAVRRKEHRAALQVARVEQANRFGELQQFFDLNRGRALMKSAFAQWRWRAVRKLASSEVGAVKLVSAVYRRLESLCERSRAVAVLRRHNAKRAALKFWYQRAFGCSKEQRALLDYVAVVRRRGRLSKLWSRWRVALLSLREARGKRTKSESHQKLRLQLRATRMLAGCHRNALLARYMSVWRSWLWQRRSVVDLEEENATLQELASALEERVSLEDRRRLSQTTQSPPHQPARRDVDIIVQQSPPSPQQLAQDLWASGGSRPGRLPSRPAPSAVFTTSRPQDTVRAVSDAVSQFLTPQMGAKASSSPYHHNQHHQYLSPSSKIPYPAPMISVMPRTPPTAASVAHSGTPSMVVSAASSRTTPGAIVTPTWKG
eukprot:PhM_4_TR7569/c0_g1_i1/m.14585